MSQPMKLDTAIVSATREGECSCGVRIEQMKFGSVWAPTMCSACAAVADQKVRQTEAEERERHRRSKALEELDIPLLYKNATIDSFAFVDAERQSRVVQRARRYLGTWEDRKRDDLEFPQVVIFAGAPGTGKGHIAWSIARSVAVEYGDSVKFTVLSDCVRDLREAWNQRAGEGPSEKARLAAYRAPELLIIDELSTHAFVGEPMHHLYDLVAWREQRLRPTILTTNEDKKALAAILGPALVSRAGGSDTLWEFGSVDYRVHRRKSRAEAA